MLWKHELTGADGVVHSTCESTVKITALEGAAVTIPEGVLPDGHFLEGRISARRERGEGGAGLVSELGGGDVYESQETVWWDEVNPKP